MTDEDHFVFTIGKIESQNNPMVVLGDHGRAAGRFQQHPTFYNDWHPTDGEMRTLGREPTWDQCFEFALRKFFRHAPTGIALVEIAVAYHLHGQHVYGHGDDPSYRQHFTDAWKAA